MIQQAWDLLAATYRNGQRVFVLLFNKIFNCVYISFFYW